VHRRDHEVTGLRRLDRRQGGLGVADLADEDHVGVLPYDVPQGRRVRIRVEADLALLDDRPFVVVDNLDGVLDRHDVRAPRPVDVADHRRDRRRLACAGRPGHQHQPSARVRELGDHGGEHQFGDGRDLRAHPPDRQPDHRPLPEEVDPEPPTPARV
jgi:hypothetical protein